MSSVEVKGLVGKLKDIETLDLKEALNKACLVVENEARKNAPVDTGELRRSITHELEDNNTGVVGTNLYYAPYIEIGTGLWSSLGTGRTDVPWRYKDEEGNWHTTSGQKPQPYLLPALHSQKDRVKQVFKDAIKKQLKEISDK